MLASLSNICFGKKKMGRLTMDSTLVVSVSGPASYYCLTGCARSRITKKPRKNLNAANYSEVKLGFRAQKKMVMGLRQFTQRTGDGAGEPILDVDNGEELMHVQPSVSIALSNRSPESPGTLYITSKQVVWLSDVNRATGYAVDFLSLSLHAVSRDPEAYPSPCIYTQIEVEDGDDDESEGSDSESDVLDLSKVTEMRLVPSDSSQLDTLFEIFCECAELNPEPIEEEQEGHNWVFSADQMANEATVGEDSGWHFFQDPTNSIGHSNGDHDLANTVLQLQINDQRFEDAEEMERDNDSSQHQ
ncbi:hypothetical protein ACOSQ2_027507 [Xanthoceras sorbifolium]